MVLLEAIPTPIPTPNPTDPVVPSQKVGLGWVPGGSSHTEPEEVLGSLHQINLPNPPNGIETSELQSSRKDT